MTHRFIQKQSGLAIMILVFMIAMVMTALAFKQYDANTLKQAQMVKTQQSLKIAKAALLAYSLRKQEPCSGSCRRPGEMPCPDLTNNGEAATACSTNRLGRLPWKTLGIDDVRDGNNERLWYALASPYKNNPKTQPLNTTTLGTISLRDSQGALRHDATNGSGLVALLLAPGQPITRQDNLVQNRNSANELVASHYLDIAFGEDNADFIDANTNGFISGKVLDSGVVIVNDVVVSITTAEINRHMQNKVKGEVIQALNEVSSSYPDPANLVAVDVTCGNVDIADNECASDSALTLGTGLIPVGDGVTSHWLTTNILRGENDGNWFQQNAWRSLISYNRQACTTGDVANCISF